MAFREFDQPQVSRRSLLRGGMLAGAGAMLAGLPLGRQLLARDMPASWPTIRAAVESYVAESKVANMLATMGWGQAAPEVIAKGVLTIGRPALADADSLYRIYSMTKPITGMAAMMLIEDGKLSLDQPIAELLPAYANMMVQKEYDGGVGAGDVVPAERPITVRQLMTHTAGLGYGIVQKGPIREVYEAAGLVPGQVSRIPIPGLGRAKPVSGLAAFADGLAHVPLVLKPGTKWSYSVGLDLLGRVIEVASGQAFDAFLQTRLFDPLGMTSTFFRVPDSEKARLTTNYGIMQGMVLPMDPADASIYLDEPAFPFGGAGLVSSPNDYDKFQRMLVGGGQFEGKRVMAEATVKLATSNLLPEGATTDGTWVAGEGFGAGGRVTGTAFGWGGAAGTAAFVDTASGLRAALFTQYMPSEAYPIQRAFPEMVEKDLAALKGL